MSYESNYNEEELKEALDFWEDIVMKDGKMDEEQVWKELTDFYFIMEKFRDFLCEATGGNMSKLTYTKGAMLSQLSDHIEQCTQYALEEEREYAQEDMKANLTELVDRICPKGGEPLSRGEAIVALAKYLIELYPPKTVEIICPEDGKVTVEGDVFDSEKPISGECPKCGDRLYFA